MRTTKIKDFSKNNLNFSSPHFLHIQKNNWNSFWKNDIGKVFAEFFPLVNSGAKKFRLDLLDYNLGNPNYENYLKAKEKDDSFSVPFSIKLRLTDLKTKKIRREEIFVTDFPMMSERATFVIKGVEKVLVSQLIRSPGVFFRTEESKGTTCFGAIIIPSRGSWLEFQSNKAGAIQVKINRRSKIPVTTLLRAFGISTDKEIYNLFAKVDKGKTKHIQATLDKDLTHNQDEAFIDIYHRLRPGEMVSSDTARGFVESMFFDLKRYDLSEVGRWKINQRLFKKTTNEDILFKERVLKVEDVVSTVREIIRLNNTPGSQPDQIDHLGNRRIRGLSELLQEQVRLGLTRVSRIAQDRMATFSGEEFLPSYLINPRPLTILIKSFFNTSGFSQFMDNDNPLAALENKRRLTATGPGGLTRQRAGFEARDVQPSHYGRICPIETPEGQNIGLVSHLASVAQVNKYGFLQTPYFKVKKGKVSKEVVYLDAYEEEAHVIAHAGILVDSKRKIIPEQVDARAYGVPAEISRDKIDLMDVSVNQIISVAASLIPFLCNDDAVRAMMGCNMQRQAVPLINPEIPLVGTGTEEKVARESGQILIAEEDGKVTEVDGAHIKVGRKTYTLQNFVRSNQYTCLHQQPIVELGQKVKKGDILTDGAAITQGRLSLGRNLLVAFMPFKGMNYEDAIVISERLTKENVLSSVHIESFVCEVRNTKLGPEKTTSDIPNIGEEKLKDLDNEGIIRIGAKVGPNDILVGKIAPKGQVELSAEERLVKAIFGEKAKKVKDVSLRVPYGKKGVVTKVHIFSRKEGSQLNPRVLEKIKVEIAQLRKIEVGDKLSGRHGNKGIISYILPEEEMPFLADGTPVDIVLNPLGVISRMNVGQILETHLGWAADKLGYSAVIPALIGLSEEEIKDELREANLPESGQIELYDGETGKKFPSPITVGKMYVLKLHHMVQDKIHMRSTGPYSLITQQPLGGKAQFGGQRLGEMEVWALEGYGAAYTLQEMLTIKSDDVRGRAEAYEAILRGKPIEHWYQPASLSLLINELKALSLDMKIEIEK